MPNRWVLTDPELDRRQVLPLRIARQAEYAGAGNEGESECVAADDLASLFEVLGLLEHFVEPTVGTDRRQVVHLCRTRCHFTPRR